MKNIFFLTDPFQDLLKFSNQVRFNNIQDLEVEALSRTAEENQKEYHHLGFTLLITNRWFFFILFIIGYFWLPAALLYIYGITQMTVNLISVLLLGFGLSHYFIYERSYMKNIGTRNKLKTYRSLLKKVIKEQEK